MTTTDAGPEPVDPAATAHTKSRYNLVAPLYNLMEAPIEHFLYRPWRRRLWGRVEGPKVLEMGVGTQSVGTALTQKNHGRFQPWQANAQPERNFRWISGSIKVAPAILRAF